MNLPQPAADEPQTPGDVVVAAVPLRDSSVVLAGVVGFLDIPHAVSLLTVLSRRNALQEVRIEQHVVPFTRALVDTVTARAWSARKGPYAAAIPISRLEWVHFGGIERRVTASLLHDMHHLVSTLPLVFGMNTANERVVYKKIGTLWYLGATSSSAESLLFNIDAVDGMAIFEMKTGTCALRVPAQDCASGSTLLCCSNCHGALGTDFACRMCPFKSCPCTCVCSDCFHCEDGMDSSYLWKNGALGCEGCAFVCVECGDHKPAAYKVGCAGRYCQNAFPENTCADCLHAALPDTAQGGQCYECREAFCDDCSDECGHPGCGNRFCREFSCHHQLLQCGLCNAFRCNHARDGGFHCEILDCSKCGDLRCFTCELDYCDCAMHQYCFDCASTEMVGGRCPACRQRGRHY